MGSFPSTRRRSAIRYVGLHVCTLGLIGAIATGPAVAQTNERVAAAAASAPADASTVTRVESAVAAGGITPPNVTSARRATTGMPSADDILNNQRITLSPQARDDLENDLVDGRVLAVLLRIARTHTISVGVLISGHSRYVKGTDRVSNHVGGRAADIFRVDGVPVNGTSDATYDALNLVLALPAAIRPDEIGGPWDVDGGAGVVGFTDPGHRDHIHIGFDD